jgi:hypothetical protein
MIGLSERFLRGINPFYSSKQFLIVFFVVLVLILRRNKKGFLSPNRGSQARLMGIP